MSIVTSMDRRGQEDPVTVTLSLHSVSANISRAFSVYQKVRDSLHRDTPTLCVVYSCLCVPMCVRVHMQVRDQCLTSPYTTLQFIFEIGIGSHINPGSYTFGKSS